MELDKHVTRAESDALKQDEFPVARHVERLLELHQTEAVSGLVKLPSEGDKGERGTLFELMIQPRPLEDGTRADRLFVHVHTTQPVSAEECTSLPFESFAAIHVKNARQVNLGARWEQMQEKLGNLGSSVHRGRVTQSLWDSLRAVAGTRLPAS